MEKGPEIAASSAGGKGPDQHAIDVGRGDHGDGKGEDVEAVGKERVAVAEEVQSKKKSKRVAALDAFRGLTIVLMILVDDAGGAYERIDHSPWNGCTLADFVMPFFLFIVGVAIAFALKRVPNIGAAVKKIVVRTLKMLFWGLLLQGGYSHAPDDLSYGVDMKKIRWCGILQRIALVYFVVALIEAFTTKVQCGVRGHLGQACNAVGYVDRQTHKERLKHWLLMGFSLLVLGIILHYSNAIPINKQLYSFSYVCFTAGVAGVILSAFYILIDVWGLRTPFLFLEWIGMNAMLVFVLGAQGILAAFVNGWYYESPDDTLVHWIVKHVFVNVWHSQRLGTLLYVIFGEIVFWGVVAGILHKLRIYWKL
ncbi:hypothetical protein PR202_gb16452 [Eleusine coracana subsp. coracana]|uniref:Heparan-alpha-glucosaminide N-acetyltransferase catalytic domain-containing protein n=1 Tax=Eleusine coracana subsp. coracana TaxID=191504 RepID=A0AAV5F115_ELECO|nr:hypothetical protein PR202_gb16452 [Eleusine coracana subsp. coracana]